MRMTRRRTTTTMRRTRKKQRALRLLLLLLQLLRPRLQRQGRPPGHPPARAGACATLERRPRPHRHSLQQVLLRRHRRRRAAARAPPPARAPPEAGAVRGRRAGSRTRAARPQRRGASPSPRAATGRATARSRRRRSSARPSSATCAAPTGRTAEAALAPTCFLLLLLRQRRRPREAKVVRELRAELRGSSIGEMKLGNAPLAKENDQQSLRRRSGRNN